MTVSIVFVRALVDELQSRGLNAQPLLEASGVGQEQLADLRAVVEDGTHRTLTTSALALSRDPGLGLTIGSRAPESMLQVLGVLMVAQPTMRDAIQTLLRYASILDEDSDWELSEGERFATLSLSPRRDRDDAYTRCCVEYALAMTMRIGRHFVRPTDSLHRVDLQHAKPSYASRYRELFNCPVAFDQPRNALVFSRAYLDRPHLHADPTLSSELQRTADTLLVQRQRRDHVAQRVRVFLRHGQELSRVDPARLARQVGCSERSLRRRLAAEGTSLTMLVDEARCQAACEYLTRPGTTVSSAAEKFGFSATRSFHRAFRRWTGETPWSYRAAKRAQT